MYAEAEGSEEIEINEELLNGTEGDSVVESGSVPEEEVSLPEFKEEDEDYEVESADGSRKQDLFDKDPDEVVVSELPNPEVAEEVTTDVTDPTYVIDISDTTIDPDTYVAHESEVYDEPIEDLQGEYIGEEALGEGVAENVTERIAESFFNDGDDIF
jgi:hypothetical protein